MNDSISEFLSASADTWMADEKNWKEKLLKLPNWHQIPLINSNASHHLSDGSLVRFRGMIQDMHNPEFYFEQFEVFNTATNEIKKKSGKYRDTAHVLENEKINYTENLLSSERHPMIVVSIPGFNKWAQKMEDDKNHLKHLEHQPNTSKRIMNLGLKLKRTFDESENDSNAMEVESEPNKELKTSENTDSSNATVVSQEYLLNFPLPDVSSKACIVKIYEKNETLKLNDIIEVVGFLSVDPSLSGEFQIKNSFLEPEMETEVETLTHNPPPSLVPRLHAVYVKKLDHCNPLITEDLDQATILKDATLARDHLLKALTELLLGDKLAAEYLICHLIASVYGEDPMLKIGQVCLNLSNLPTDKYPDYAKQLYEIIKQFVTTSYYLPLTIDNLNTLTFQPKKDYDSNRLTSGILQLSKSTHLVLDETKMEQGHLDAAGVQNLAALGYLIKTQKLEYDFRYYKMDFDSDVSVLILSEGKSLLPSDFYLPLKPEESSLKIFDAIVEAATYYLKEEIMNIIRVYLTSLKLAKYTISENSKFVEDYFVESRSKADPNNLVTADDLHRLLVLARLVSLSRGFDTLNEECWDIARSMEEERLNRIKNRC